MITEMRPSSDIAFTDTVKALQARRGSRRGYAAMEARGGWQTEITDDLAAFIAAQRSFFLATANAEGQPYIQHRGGPPGFLRVLDARTLGFADFRGNRQHISEGNLIENPRAFLFLIDYATRSRIKIWGTARFEEDPEVVARLMPEGYDARGERAVLFDGGSLGCQLPTAHSAAVRGGGRGPGARHAGPEDRRTRGGACPAARRGLIQIKVAGCLGHHLRQSRSSGTA